MENLQSIMSRIQLILFGFISSILIILFSIAGCSDPSHTGSIGSYTGSMLTPADVDDYLTSNRGGIYCIHNDTDSSCIDLIPLVKGGVDTNGPIIHIYPEKTLYLFYHEGTPIVRAERIGDTTDFVEKLPVSDKNPPNRGPSTPGSNDNGNNDDDNNGGDDNDNTNGGDDNNGNNGNNGKNGGDNSGNNGGDNNGGDDNNGNNGGDNNGNNGDDNNGNNGGDNNGNNGDDNTNGGDNTGNNGDDDNEDNPDNTDPADNTSDGHGWLIWIYYPEGTAPINPPTLSESNVTITINGKQLTDEDITGFAQFIGTEGERGIQFFYPTESAELLDLKVQMFGITDREGNVRFNINYLWNSN